MEIWIANNKGDITTMSTATRFTGIDLIKALATIFVLSVHFFLNTQYYNTSLVGDNMFVQTYLRMLFLMCVPIFLITTGFLSYGKMPTKKYYKKLIPIIVIYLFYAIISLLYTDLYLDIDRPVYEAIATIFTFHANGYSWYINMYIGLFLISPYLNIIYKNLLSRRHKVILLCVLLFMTALPDLINGYLGGKLIAAPYYWVDFYPITYYFIGTFIREYQFKINKKIGSILLASIVLVEVILEYSFADGGIFLSVVGYYPSLIIAAQSALFFLLFYDVNIKSKVLLWPVSIISLLSLDIYLASFITDNFIYKFIREGYVLSQHQMLFLFIPVVIVSFLLSFSLAYFRYKTIRVR